MTIKLFPDLIDAFAKALCAVKGVTRLPKAERECYRHSMDETYRLVHTTVNMVIVRLGDFLTPKMKICKSLRVALRESEGLTPALRGHISTYDWEALLAQMGTLLATEGEVAEFLS